MSHSMRSLQHYKSLLEEGPSNHKDVFELFIRRASEGVREEKLLATELLCTYSKYFPDLVDNVVDKLIDLCEEDDLDVRIQVLGWLPTMIDNVPSEILRLGDVLLQLMSTDEELGAVKAAFDKILSRHPFETLDIFFYHIQVSEPSARAETLALLVEKLDRASETAGAKFQVYLLKKIKEFLCYATESDFRPVLKILDRLSLVNSPIHKPWLVSLDAAIKIIPFPWSPLSEEMLTQLVQGYTIQNASGFSSLVSFGIIKNFEEIPANNQQLLLQLFVENTPICSKIDAELCLPNLYRLLKKELPVPTEDSESGLLTFPSFNFTILEPLLFFFHQVISLSPSNLFSVTGLQLDAEYLKKNKIENEDQDVTADPDVLWHDFISRIFFLQHYSKLFATKLRDSLMSALNLNVALSPSDETVSFRINAINTTQNIHHLCKALSRRNITPVTNLIFSWNSQKEMIPASVYKLAKRGEIVTKTSTAAIGHTPGPTLTPASISDEKLIGASLRLSGSNSGLSSSITPKQRVVFRGDATKEEKIDVPKVVPPKQQLKVRTLNRRAGGTKTTPIKLLPSDNIVMTFSNALRNSTTSTASAPNTIQPPLLSPVVIRPSLDKLVPDAPTKQPNVMASLGDIPFVKIVRRVDPLDVISITKPETEAAPRRQVILPKNEETLAASVGATHRREVLRENKDDVGTPGTRVITRTHQGEGKRKVEFSTTQPAKKAKQNNNNNNTNESQKPTRKVFKAGHQNKRGKW